MRRGLGVGLEVDAGLAQQYRTAGWWISESGSDLLSRWARQNPDEIAIVDDHGRYSWRDYDARASELAAVLAGLGMDADSCAAVWLDDSFEFHVALVAAERARVVALGVGARAGAGELAQLMRGAGAQVLISTAKHRDTDVLEGAERIRAQGMDLRYVVLLGERLQVHRLGTAAEPEVAQLGGGFGPDEFSLLNSTSGTTGLPKLVAHHANQWFAFARLAQEAAGLSGADVFGGLVPGPFGFGLWTAHYAPLYFGARTVVTARFTPAQALRLIAAEGITMLSCVSTQFKMLLNADEFGACDFSSLRVMYTGGEAVPADKATEFERQTGALVLQFYGSNEAGAVSATTAQMPLQQRLTTAGRVLDMMDVVRYDDAGGIVASPGAVGQPGVRGPTSSLGYFRDCAANDELFSPDGRILLADLITVDEGGWVTVTGRKSDIIIRGGKNISSVQVEAVLEGHPLVALAAVVPVPDPVFGERVCAVVETLDRVPLDHTAMTDYLASTDLPRESWPEYVVWQAQLPRASGGKVAKGQVREFALHELGMKETSR